MSMLIVARIALAVVPAIAIGTFVDRTALGVSGSSSGDTAAGIHKIRHVVIIMQENRSFDSYFGTYPGVDGIPMRNGVPTVCEVDPRTGRCQKPYHDRNDANGGGPHSATNAVKDISGGKIAPARRYAAASGDRSGLQPPDRSARGGSPSRG